jgi:hypothetical protein
VCAACGLRGPSAGALCCLRCMRAAGQALLFQNAIALSQADRGVRNARSLRRSPGLLCPCCADTPDLGAALTVVTSILNAA